ncbi:MAG: dephospho-CoA kinase [Gallionellaceae bacterium]
MKHVAPEHLLIGLTGGIGSGKSTVAALFEKLGARIIDTDELAHQLTQPDGAAIAAIRDAFGDTYIDSNGALNRQKMRELVFSHPAEITRLESILHPAIYKQSMKMAAAITPAAYTLLVVPLLFESPEYCNHLHRSLVVDCPEEVQISRTMQRSNLSKTDVQSIMAQQLPRTQRTSFADDVIHNEADIPNLTTQITLLHHKYLAISGRSS